MLEEFNKVDWSAINHSYGKAVDLPDLVRNLLSDNPELRDRAELFISNRLNHQQNPSEAALHLIPFLVQFLKGNETPDKYRLLRLLEGFAHATSFQFDSPMGEHLTEEERKQGVLKEQILVQNLYEAVRQGIEVYYQLLANSDPKTRELAASLLLSFPEKAIQSTQHIYQQVLVETEVHTKVRLLITIGYFFAQNEKISSEILQFYTSQLQQLLQSADNENVKIAITAALLGAGREKISQNLREQVIEYVRKVETNEYEEAVRLFDFLYIISFLDDAIKISLLIDIIRVLKNDFELHMIIHNLFEGCA